MAWRGGFAGQAAGQAPQWQQQVRPGGQQWAPNVRPVAGVQQPVAQKRPPLAAPGAQMPVAAPPQQQGPETYVVYSKGEDHEEVVVRTLVGDYVEQGSNHGRKVYKKSSQGGEAVDVFLYYWDARDGPAFEGWWFGNKLGGTQVWSHCLDKSLTPPNAGWKIPWDGSVRPTLVVQNKAEQQAAESQERLQQVGGIVSRAEAAAKSAMEQARALVGDYSSQEGLKSSEQLLTPQVPTLNEALRRLTEAQRAVSGQAANQLQQMGSNVRSIQTAVSAELAKVRAARSKVEHAEKQKACEEKDMVSLQEVLPEAVARTNAAEDAVEKATITNEMINAGGDDLDEVRQAVMQTEAAAQEAQKAIGEARIYLNAKLASTRRYESEKVKQMAADELGKLQAQLQEAQNKLNPLKTVRQDFVQRTAAQKLVAEVLDKLSPAEVDVDRAEEATVLLAGEGLTKETMAQAEAAVTKASDHLATVTKFLEQKKKSAVGMAKDEVAKLEERTRNSQTRLQQLRNVHKEAAERVTCETLLQEAQEKLQTVATNVAKAADAEGPFLMGVEELPLEETLQAVKVCEVASTAANTAVSIARMFLATKMVEAKRFSAGPSRDTLAKLKDFQAELEVHTKKLTDLKKATAGRKKLATMREVETEVTKAEELSKKVALAGALFEDDSKLLQLTSKEIRAASDETVKAEQEANAALSEARKFITARQIEAKGKDASSEVSSELIKYQARLSSAQAEVGKFKKLSSTVELRLAAKKSVEDAQAKLKATEEKVAKVVELVDALGREDDKKEESKEEKEGKDGEKEGKEEQEEGKKEGEAKEEPAKEADAEQKTPPKSPVKAAEQAAAEAQVALKTLSRFLEAQSRSQGLAKDEIAKLQPLVKASQEKLDENILIMRERSEKLAVDGLVKESEAKVKEAEESLKKVVEAEEPFSRAEELHVDEASSALAELESAVSGAHTAVGGAKTFLAMKRLAAKRLSEMSMKAATAQLGELQARVDAAAKKLSETKKGMVERKLATVKREVAEKVVDVEAKVAAAAEATKALASSEREMAAEEMKGACEKAGSAQQAAQTVLTATKNLLLSRQKDAKTAAADSAMLGDIAKMLEKLGTIQADMDKQKGLLRDQEHRFVAQRLLKDATDMLESLEKKLETTTEIAAPLTSEKEELTAAIYLSQAVDALKAHIQKASKSPKDLCSELSADGKVSEAKFVALCAGLPELSESKDTMLSEEQLKAAFARLAGKAGEVKEGELLDQFRCRYLCAQSVSMTGDLSVKGGKTVRKLEVNEIVEALGEPTKDDAVGLMRVQCRAESDDKEGYVTLSGNQGTIYLEPYSPHTAMQRKIERALQECADAAKEVAKHLEQKSEELKAVKTGPLAETKAELAKMRPRVSKVQYEHSQLKKKIGQSEKRMKEAMEHERKRRQEEAEKKAAASVVEEAEGIVAGLASEIEKVLPATEALVKSRGADQENPLAAMDKADESLEAVVASIEKGQAKIKEHMDSIKTAAKGPFTEARSSLVKLKVKVGALDAKCKKQIVAVKGARKQVASDAHTTVTGALRDHLLSKGVKTDEFFKELSQGKAEITQKRLREYLEKLPGEKLKASILDMGLDRYAGGLTRLAFSGALQEYQRCVKDIAITTAFQVKDSKTLRKLQIGEVVEVLEAAKVDDSTGLQRVKCRALTDLKEGWATLRGNQGTDFLEKSSKPYFCCEEPTSLTSGEEAKQVQPGEVLEVVEGPQKEPPQETQRVRGKAWKDAKTGWATLKDAAGAELLEPAKLLACKQSIAITTTFDIAQGKAIRKLEVGEPLEVLEEAKEDEVRSLTRCKARAKRDGVEGFVTMKGNQGTGYTEESDKFYIVKRPTGLDAKFPTSSNNHRQLEEGEIFEVTDGPKTETKEGLNRVKGRHLSDGSEGWFTLTSTNMHPWSPQYKCTSSTSLTDGLDIKEGKTIRKVEPPELLEALETPVLEKSTGMMRVRVRADKDGAVGYATVRSSQGRALLKPALGDA